MSTERFDYVIVGAGSAGCVLAARLSEDPNVRVLLLEAGGEDRRREIHIPAGFPSLFESEVDWAYRTESEPTLDGRRLFWPRGKVLGGSSSINAMLYIRGHRRDYDRWAEVGNPGWSYDEVLPYFKRAEDQSRGADRFHGVGGPLTVSDPRSNHPLTARFLAAAAEAGYEANHDFNGARQAGFGHFQVTQRRGRRASVATTYLAPARRRSNLVVRTDALVLGIEFDGHRAIGVRYRHAGDVRLAAADGEVMLSAGAINSPQILMLSGIGPAAQLASLDIPVVADLPAVGANLQDHPAIPIVFRTHSADTLDTAETLPNLLRYLLLRRGPFTTTVCEACGFVRSAPDLPQPDLQINFLPTALVDNGFDRAADHGIDIAPTILRPESRGRVFLRSADPREPVRIESRYFESGADMDTAIVGVRLARALARTDALAPIIDREVYPTRRRHTDPDDATDAAIAEDVRRVAQTLYHPVSTCRMGPRPDGATSAVVDAALRVHGVDRLRVVDASVMPDIPGSNTNAPTIMIAEKAADMIRGIHPPISDPKPETYP